MRSLLLLFCFLFIAVLAKVSKKENERIQAQCAATHSTNLRKKRLLYGERVPADQLTHVVNVQIGIGEGAARCSGTIISSRHVITAAHCFSDKDLCKTKIKDASKLLPPKRTFIHFGGNCIVLNPSTGSCAGGVLNRMIEVSRVVVPSLYAESGCNAGDIAIVELKEKLLGVNDTELACLPVPKQPLPPRVYAAGYGLDPNNAQVPQKFKERAEFNTEKYCDYSLSAPKDSFCTEEERAFLCRGDSGSGMMHTVSDGRKVVFGVLSRGVICSVVQTFVDNPVPGKRFRGSINTDARRYLKWICGNSGVCVPGVNPKVNVKKLTTVVFG